MLDVHLILDIDSTLIESYMLKDKNFFNELKSKNTDNNIIFYSFVGDDNIEYNVIFCKRPGLDEFLDFIFSKFKDVSIWSAGINRYVNSISYKIFGEERFNKLKLLYSRKHCDQVANLSFKKIFSIKGFEPSKTIILDDNDTTFTENVENAFHINYFGNCYTNINQGIISYNKNDKDLYKFINYFKNISNVPDVRKLNKKIFV